MTFDQIQDQLDQLVKNHSVPLYSKVSDVHLVHYKDNCDISKVQGYELCFQMDTCNLCTTVQGCGWCQISHQCLPGNLTTPACSSSCMNKWTFRKDICPIYETQNTVAGKIYSTASLKLTNPEIADPKVLVNTKITYPAIVHTPVLLGHQLFYQKKTTQMPDGNTRDRQKYRKEPIYGTLHEVVDIDVPHS